MSSSTMPVVVPSLSSSSSRFDKEICEVRPTREEVLACQFTSWYDDFSEYTIRSIVIPLEDGFLKYILSDGIKLPAGTNVSSCAKFATNCPCDWSCSDDDDDNDDDEGDEASSVVEGCHEYLSFPDLTVKIEEAIDRLGGAVLPKLNWSAPKDGTWINEGTMKCQTAGDVYILMKSSDFICHDLTHAFSNCVSDDDDKDPAYHNDGVHSKLNDLQYYLVLRKWCNLHVSMEFRCFVSGKSLVAISQRDHTQYYPYLKNEKEDIQREILRFFLDIIRPRFYLQYYVFDCYIDRKRKVHLIDFNVWGSSTDSLLFQWDDLNALFRNNQCGIETNIFFEVVENEGEVHHNPLASYRAPIDAIDLATDSESFHRFMDLCVKP